MRKLLSFALAALFGGTALVACDQLPNQPADTQEVQASQQGARAGMHAERVWGNDHLWRFYVPQTVLARLKNSSGVSAFSSPADPASHSSLYLIGPDAGDDGPQAKHGIGPHDHVRPVPPGNDGHFSATCNLQSVVPSPHGDVAASEGLAHAADTDGDGSLEELTSAEKVRGAASLGNVMIFGPPTPITFTCPVEDIEG